MKRIIRNLCPPIIWKLLSSILGSLKGVKADSLETVTRGDDPDNQQLDLYWDPEYANLLDEWGKDHVWNEVQLALADKEGKVLDIACGSGPTIKILEKYPKLDLYGFDISDLLITKAIEKGITQSKIQVNDATKTNYENNEFDYSYSIGSLEHFTLEGIDQFIRESARYTKKVSYHMIPVSRSNENEGWMTTVQSFFNNSESWWKEKFAKHYSQVYSIPSKWEDKWSVGRWYVCIK
ncbi:MAG: class I SAM-dependent methyltransferase [Flavobacteriales bacterium]|nr:class I SAM-dependent methyltransferase [Flavobacteriales bacterium]